MIVAAAAAAGLALASPHPAAPTKAAPSEAAWTARVLGWTAAGLGACLRARTAAEAGALAAGAGARLAPSPPLASARLLSPVWVFGPRGEVTLTARDAPDGERCTVEALSGEARLLARDLPRLAVALGFVRTPTTPARWPGESAWRGRRAPAAGAYLAAAAPLVHGAPYGALLVVSRPAR